MGITAKVVETTGTVDANHQLVLDEPLPVDGPARVRVLVLLPEDADMDEKEWLSAASSNPAFDFLKHPEEDIYTLSDGRPIDDSCGRTDPTRVGGAVTQDAT